MNAELQILQVLTNSIVLSSKELLIDDIPEFDISKKSGFKPEYKLQANVQMTGPFCFSLAYHMLWSSYHTSCLHSGTYLNWLRIFS